MDLRTFFHVTLESAFALFCLLSAIYIRLYNNDGRKTPKVLIAALLTNTVINIADATAYIYRGDPTEFGSTMVRVSNFLVFIGMFALLALGNLLLDTMLKEKGSEEDWKQYNIVYIICLAAAVLIVLSNFFGFL